MKQTIYLCGELGQHKNKITGQPWGKTASLKRHVQTGFGPSVAFYQVGTSSSSSLCQVIKSTFIWTENRWLLYTFLEDQLKYHINLHFLLLNTSTHFLVFLGYF
jgi:hypothetical protein